MISKIPNAVDRIERLEIVAEAYGRIRRTDTASELIRLAFAQARVLEGVSSETVIASVVQTAHQIDPSVAINLTEQLEDGWQRLSAKKMVKSLNTAKSLKKTYTELRRKPGRGGDPSQSVHKKMLEDLVAGRGVAHASSTILDALCAIRWLDLEDALKVGHWAVENRAAEWT